MTENLPAIISAVFAKDIVRLQEVLNRDRSGVNASDSDGRTALMHAAIDGQKDLVTALLQNGADPNLNDKVNGNTALHFAAQGWHLEVVKLLLASGARVDSTDKFGNTPLWRAVFESKGRGEVIKALVAAGANKGVKNNKGTSPEDLAKRIANYDVAIFL